MTEGVPFDSLLAYPLRSGFTVASSDRGEGIRMLNMGELFAFPRISDVDMARVHIAVDNPERTLLSPGDLMFARRSLTLEGAGKCSIVHEVIEPTTWESSIIRARLDARLADPYFYYYYFASPGGRRTMETIVEQVAAAGIRITDLARLRVPNPPLREQRAIAEVLGALDDKIAANAKLAARAGALAELIYEAGTADAATQRMSDALTPVLGGTPSRSKTDYWGGTNLWISARDVTGAANGVVIETEETITDQAIRETKAKPLPTDSVILTARGTVGAVARLGRPASFNQSCYGFVPGDTPAGVLYFAIRKATDHAKSLAHGSVFDTITMKTFDHLYMPDLSASDSALLEGKLDPLLKSVAQASIENRALAATRDALLPQLMSGKLRVKDAEALVAEAV